MEGNLNALDQGFCNEFYLLINGQEEFTQQMLTMQEQMQQQMQDNHQAIMKQMQEMQQQLQDNHQVIMQQMQEMQQQIQQQLQDNHQAIMQQMQEIQQQVQAANMASIIALNNIQHQLANLGHQQMSVAERNKRHRKFNKTCGHQATLQKIVRNDNMVPDNFPVNKIEISDMNDASLDLLLPFYGLVQNGTVRTRRKRLLDFIEVGPNLKTRSGALAALE